MNISEFLRWTSIQFFFSWALHCTALWSHSQIGSKARCLGKCISSLGNAPTRIHVLSNSFKLKLTSLLCTFFEHHGHSTGMNLHSLCKCSSTWLSSCSLAQPKILLGQGTFLYLQDSICSCVYEPVWQRLYTYIYTNVQVISRGGGLYVIEGRAVYIV